MVNTRRRKKKRKVNYARIVLVVVAVALVGLTAFLGVDLLLKKMGFSLPTELKSDLSDSAEVHRLTDDVGIAIYYPTFTDTTMTGLFATHADEILIDLLKQEIMPQEETQYVKVEYTKTDYQNKYVSVAYKFDYMGQSYEYDYFYDMQGNTFNNEVVDDFLKHQISLDARAFAKMDSALKDVAHSIDFAQKTKADQLNPFKVLVSGENLLIEFEDYYQGYPLKFGMDLKEIANHVNLDLGIAQTIANDELRIPKRYVDPEKPMIALTFDDGPYAPNTNQLIDTLYEYDGVATYYVLGNRIKGEESTMIRNIANGNEIGSHSYGHPDLRTINDEQLSFQLTETSRIVNEDLTKGLYSIKTFRTPYGAKNDNVSSKSPYPFIMWSIDTLDWKHRDPNQTVRAIMDYVKDGDIILMHDIHEPSIKGAIEAIKQLKDAGYQLVTVSELFEAKGIVMDNGKNYHSTRGY